MIKDTNIKLKTDDLKPDTLPQETAPSFTLQGLYPTLAAPEQPASGPEIIDIPATTDIDETSSLANFFSDMKQLAKDKDLDVSGTQRPFTLFEDANEVEK